MANTNPNEIAIETAGLRKLYHPGLFQHGKTALQGLDLQVPEGCIYGYLGQNGAGKTTTINILVGLQHPTAGRAWIRGVDIHDPASRQKIGFMPENPYFYEYLTAFETLDFYGQLSGLKRAARRKRADELLDLFGLTASRNVRMRGFSKGMRQRLGLAQAIIHQPPVVILDEPMTGLDPLGRRAIREIILQLRDRLCTVFFSSHILSDVADICDQVCVIHKGQKISSGAIHSLLSSKIVEVELAASGIARGGHAEAARLARRAWHDGTLFHLVLESEERAQQAKELLEKAGGRLRKLIPQHESLEAYFIRVTNGSDHAAAAAHAVQAQGPEAAKPPSAPGEAERTSTPALDDDVEEAKA